MARLLTDCLRMRQGKVLFSYLSCMWGLNYDLEGVSYLVPLLINRAVNYRLVVGEISDHLAHLFTKVLYRNRGTTISPVTWYEES